MTSKTQTESTSGGTERASLSPVFSEEQTVQSLELSSFLKSPFQPRLRSITKKDVSELMQSLLAVGQTTPLVVAPAAGLDGKFYVHQGERRWRAAQFLGWSHLRVVVRTDLDDSAARRMAIADNLAREDLTAWEQARALDGYCNAENVALEEAAQHLGISRATAFRLKAILSASDSLAQILEQTNIAARPADLLARIDAKSPRRAASLAQRFVEGLVSTKTLEDEVAKERGHKPRAAARRDVQLVDGDRTIEMRIHLVKQDCGDEQKRRVIAAVSELFATLQINIRDVWSSDCDQSPAETEMPPAHRRTGQISA